MASSPTAALTDQCIPSAQSAPNAPIARTIDPSSGKILTEYRLWSSEQASDALGRAWAARESWRRRSASDRAEAIAPLADALRAREDDLSAVLTAEMGKPLAAARAEIRKAADAVTYVVENAPAALAPEDRAADGSGRTVVRHDPLGPLLGIMPWNYPYWQSARFFLPALVAGNVVLTKPAPSTLGSAAVFQSVIDSIELPEGVLQTVPTGVDVIAELIADPRLRGVSLTGSARAGRAVAALAGHHLTKVVLELGGSDPFIVLPDADVGSAVEAAVTSRMQNSGQSCIAAKRFLVHDQVAEEFVAGMVAEVRRLVVGDPTDPAVSIGPLASADAVRTVEAQVAASVDAGAGVAVGGARLDRPGFFYEPTVLTGVDASMPCVAEEVFGPVAAVSTFTDVDDAVQQADASEYGLGASVWTADPGLADDVAARLDVGQVFVNAMVVSDPRHPFGGVKNSGFGRELGVEGFREFTNVKLVRVMA